MVTLSPVTIPIRIRIKTTGRETALHRTITPGRVMIRIKTPAKATGRATNRKRIPADAVA